MSAIGRATVFLPAGAFLALGLMFLGSGVVESEWFQLPILKGQGTRKRRIFLGVISLVFGVYNLYTWRSALFADLLLNLLIVGAGFLVVLGGVFIHYWRSR